jgi:hypothetical protein
MAARSARSQIWRARSARMPYKLRSRMSLGGCSKQGVDCCGHDAAGRSYRGGSPHVRCYANEVTFASTSRGKEERSRIVKPFNLDDVCPDGSAAVELPASSPWRRKTKHPSCAPGGQKEHNERFVSY